MSKLAYTWSMSKKYQKILDDLHELCGYDTALLYEAFDNTEGDKLKDIVEYILERRGLRGSDGDSG